MGTRWRDDPPPPPPYYGNPYVYYGSRRPEAPRDDGSSLSQVALIPGPTARPASRDSFSGPLKELRGKPSIEEKVRRYWVLEILWCVVGLACTVAIIAVLAKYDQQKAPEWPLGITLNTFLAFLASLAKVALLIPVTEGLGQLRWIWFARKARRADDFELFESATRGTFGSLRLLVSLKGGILGFTAALILLSSLLVSTVTQGSIDYKTQLHPSGHNVTVPRITTFSAPEQFFLDDTDRTYRRSLNLKHHIASGAYTPWDKTIPADPIECTTGNCDFPDFVTIGVCSDVADITAHLNTSRPPDRDWGLWGLPGLFKNNSWSASLPGGLNLTIPTIYALNFWFVRTSTPSLEFSHLQNQSLVNLFMTYSNLHDIDSPNPSVSFHAVELVWYWCTKSYRVSVHSGQPKWTELSRSTKVLDNTATTMNAILHPTAWLCAYQVTDTPCSAYKWGNLSLALPAGNVTSVKGGLVVEESTSLALSSILMMSFMDGISNPFTGEQQSEWGGMFRGVKKLFYRVQGELTMAFGVNLWRDMNESVETGRQLGIMRNLAGNIGLGLENFVRSDWKVHPLTEGPVNGTVMTPTTFVVIRWQWLVYLFVELVLSSLFLIAIITWTAIRKAEVLGSSTLATLCALDEPTRKSLGHVGDYHGLTQRASKVTVRLTDGSDGLALRRMNDDIDTDDQKE